MSHDPFAVRVFPVKGKKLYRLELWYNAARVNTSLRYEGELLGIYKSYTMQFTRHRLFFWFIAKWMLWHARRELRLQIVPEDPIVEYR